MNNVLEGAVTIGMAIIGVAILALLISPRSRTAQVIQATASGFSNSLATAMTPVTGQKVNIDTSYPSVGPFGGLGMGAFE